MGKIASRIRKRAVERMSESKQTTALVAGFLVLFIGGLVYFGKYAPKLSPEPKTAMVATTGPAPPKPVRVIHIEPVKAERVWLDDPKKKPKPLGQGGIGGR